VTARRFVFDSPDRFTTGTVGEPGSRTFFLQAKRLDSVVSVVLEKVQVAVLAERLDQLLDELEERGLTGSTAPASAQPDTEPLDEPLVEAFRATTLTLGWDGDAGRILVEARAETDEDETDEEEDVAETDADEAAADAVLVDALDEEEGPDLLRVRLTADAARAFVERAVRVLSGGRPPCPLCGEPLDPTGHLCPRRNGNYLN
jgi:uncharacterized repeat protein (TIGR03847 family)